MFVGLLDRVLTVHVEVEVIASTLQRFSIFGLMNGGDRFHKSLSIGTLAGNNDAINPNESFAELGGADLKSVCKCHDDQKLEAMLLVLTQPFAP